jgi:hypothetical protein
LTFQHEFYPKTEFPDVIIDGKRYYDSPAGKFKSVTTIIGEKSDKSWLGDWRARVGDDEADQILHQAQVRGTAIHNMAEKYVLNDPQWKRGSMPINVITFRKIARQLDKNLGKVYGIEYPLWSEMLQTAGRTDLPAQWLIDGEYRDAIVDFKTSRGTKRREDIPGYFIQATTYAVMFEEITGRKMPYCVVIVAQDNEDEASVFIERCRDWYPEVARVFMGK